MEPKRNYVLVGIFVLVGVVLFFGFIAWLTGKHDTRDYRFYRVYFTDSVTGLNEGGSVKYRGVEVGKVHKIEIDPENPLRIMVTIRVAESTPVKKDSIASLKSQGITGLSYMELAGGSINSPPLEPEEGQRYAVIPSEPSQLTQLFNSVPELMARLTHAAEQLGKVVSDENVSNLTTVLSDMQKMTSVFASNAQNIDRMIESTSRAMERVAATAATVDQFTRSSRADAQELLRASQKAVSELSSLLAQANGSGYTQTYQMIVEMKNTAREIKELARGLKENPSRIIVPPKESGVKIP